MTNRTLPHPILIPPQPASLRLGAALVAIGCLAGSFSRAWPQCTYDVAIIQAPPCGQTPSPTRGLGINESGHVVGYYSPCLIDYSKAYLWTGGAGVITLPAPAGAYDIRAFDISNTALNGPIGQIVGGHYPSSTEPVRGFLYDNAQWTILPCNCSTGGHSAAFAINDAQTIVGYQTNPRSGQWEAVMWQNGPPNVLEVPQGPRSIANDISASGAIVGWMGQNTTTNAHGFLSINGKVTDLGFLPKSTLTDPSAINSHQDIVGRGIVPAAEGSVAHAFLWRGGQLTDLGTLPGMIRSFALDINDAAEIVGFCHATQSSPTLQRAVIWRNGLITDLNTLISNGSGVEILRATAINNAGQIAAWGSAQAYAGEVAFMLSPVPDQAGDTNCDGAVNLDDLLNVINTWGPCLPYPAHCPADTNNDDVVNVDDLLIVINNWS